MVGDAIYVHRSALEQSDIPREVVHERSRHLPPDFPYAIVKYDRRSGAISFIQSPDWDQSSEPIVGDSYKIGADGSARFRASNPANPQIYHHKYQFVAPDYEGFDVAQARQRAREWEALRPDKRRIGYKKYWDAEVVPRLPG